MEVSWTGIVTQTGNVFTLHNIFVPDQDNTAGESTITTKGWAQAEQYFGEYSKHLRLWGHSHHSMTPNPSPQDDETGDELSEPFDIVGEYFIRLITNTEGQYIAHLYLGGYGLKVAMSVQVEIERDPMVETWLIENVREKVVKPPAAEKNIPLTVIPRDNLVKGKDPGCYGYVDSEGRTWEFDEEAKEWTRNFDYLSSVPRT